MKVLRAILCLLFVTSAAGLLAGCATDEESTSSVPWNTPPDWTGPLPSNINNGR